MQGERIIVTGATGFIGRVLVRQLLGQGAAVTAFVIESPGELAQTNFPESVSTVQVDLRYAGGVARAVKDADPTVVIHLAAVGVTDPFLPVSEALRGNLDATINLLKGVAGRCRLLIARSPHDREPMNVYAASKAAAWAFCEMYHRVEGWPIVGVMPFQAYGPGGSPRTVLGAAVKAAKAGENFPTTSGEQVRDWIYVDDVADGLIAAAQAANVEGETIELGTGIGTPLRDVVARVFQLAQSGQPMFGALPQRPGEVMSQIADADRTERLTGWQAKIGLDEGLRRILTTDGTASRGNG